MKSLTFLITFLLCSDLVLAQSEAEKHIRATRQVFNEAIARHDSIAIPAFLTDDYTMISSRNTEVKGKTGGQRALANEFRTRRAVVYVRTPTQVAVFESWHMASETGTWTGTWQEPDGKVTISGTYTAKWHQVNNQWKIRAEVFTPLKCSGSSYCGQAPGLE